MESPRVNHCSLWWTSAIFDKNGDDRLPVIIKYKYAWNHMKLIDETVWTIASDFYHRRVIWWYKIREYRVNISTSVNIIFARTKTFDYDDVTIPVHRSDLASQCRGGICGPWQYKITARCLVSLGSCVQNINERVRNETRFGLLWINT